MNEAKLIEAIDRMVVFFKKNHIWDSFVENYYKEAITPAKKIEKVFYGIGGNQLEMFLRLEKEFN